MATAIRKLLPTSTQDHHSTHTRLGEEVQYLWPLQHVQVLRTSTQDHHSTHTRLGEKHKTILVMFLN